MGDNVHRIKYEACCQLLNGSSMFSVLAFFFISESNAINFPGSLQFFTGSGIVVLECRTLEASIYTSMLHKHKLQVTLTAAFVFEVLMFIPYCKAMRLDILENCQ